MDARSKQLWIVTLANVAVASLLLLGLYGVMLALAASVCKNNLRPVHGND